MILWGSIQNLHYIVSLVSLLNYMQKLLISYILSFFPHLYSYVCFCVKCKGNLFFQAFQLGVRQSETVKNQLSTCHWGASSVSRHGRCRRGGREAHKTELSKAASRLVSRW